MVIWFWVYTTEKNISTCTVIMPPALGGILELRDLSVPWRSCLGSRHAGCLQLSHRLLPEMCGLPTRPRTDLDPPRFLPQSNCHWSWSILIKSNQITLYLYRLAAAGAIFCWPQGFSIVWLCLLATKYPKYPKSYKCVFAEFIEWVDYCLQKW